MLIHRWGTDAIEGCVYVFVCVYGVGCNVHWSQYVLPLLAHDPSDVVAKNNCSGWGGKQPITSISSKVYGQKIQYHPDYNKCGY